jgi:hypothetical protein
MTDSLPHTFWPLSRPLVSEEQGVPHELRYSKHGLFDVPHVAMCRVPHED